MLLVNTIFQLLSLLFTPSFPSSLIQNNTILKLFIHNLLLLSNLYPAQTINTYNTIQNLKKNQPNYLFKFSLYFTFQDSPVIIFTFIPGNNKNLPERILFSTPFSPTSLVEQRGSHENHSTALAARRLKFADEKPNVLGRGERGSCIPATKAGGS